MNMHKNKKFCDSPVTIGKKLCKTPSHLVYSDFWVEIWVGLSFIGVKSIKDIKFGFIL
jgi:hypothetical protein